MEEEVLHKLDDDLKKYFPDFDFKLKDFQKKVISNVIEHGNTLCIMPTGSLFVCICKKGLIVIDLYKYVL